MNADPDFQKAAELEYDQQLADLFAQLADKLQRGESVKLDDVCSEHPQFENDLRELWGMMIVTQAVGEQSESDRQSISDSEIATAFELPAQFGAYTLLEEIGRGGMGVVYLARNKETDEEFALKMMLHGDLASEISLKRFRAEAQAAKGLDHPNIIQIIDVGQQDGRAYFCMPLIRGENLATRLARGPLPPLQSARILAAVARAIDFANSRGVLHRDLKPSNILISDDDNKPYVVDFGLARDEDAESLTRTGSVLGTPAYMAPEQAAGARGQVGPRSDVYSLGAILYHMITGRPPFLAASPVDTVLMLLEQDPITPRLLNRKVDRRLEMIAMRCLQKPPDLRYASAGDLADDLTAVLNNDSVAAVDGRFGHVIGSLMRETHHAAVLENWGLLWMWHSLALLVACMVTQIMYWMGVENRWLYWFWWMFGFGAWAAVFWSLRRRMGPVTFVERQIAHLWLGSIISIGAVFPFEWYLNVDVLRLAPMLALVSGMVFLVKASILSGSFYIHAFALFVSAFFMAVFYDYALAIFGVVSAACFFFAGRKYYRQRQQRPDEIME